MGRKCCVTGCRSGYDSQDKTSVFRLPRDKCQRLRWLSAIPRDNIPDKADTVVCEKHWPAEYEKLLSYGRYRPANPPSVFTCVPQSLTPTASSKPRSTKKALSNQRSFIFHFILKFQILSLMNVFMLV
uniref:THAP domain-containing protein 1-like n=1 Tax=Phallusia mammillata TaxID=59560 RepID=A0A6F9DV80_9ASCI|nr:THAP domain-containing protein 1-like [Phallusia mammillata]